VAHQITRHFTPVALVGAAVVVGAGLLAGCAPKPADEGAAVSTAAAPPLKPVASVLDLMLDTIDVNADALWESVATVSTNKGIEERQPRTPEEWKKVRAQALAIVEGANLLMMDGRVVAHPGQQLDEPGGEGDFTPAQSQAAIDADRPTFVSYARALRDTAELMLKAIENRNPDGMLEAGGALDEACEQCHRKFWYPNSPLPPGA
jgi:cytochrome c556